MQHADRTDRTDLRLGVLAERHDAPDVVSPRIACKNGEDHAEEDVVQPQQNQHLTVGGATREQYGALPGVYYGAASAAYGRAPCLGSLAIRFEACRYCEVPQAGTSAALHEEYPRDIHVMSTWYPRGRRTRAL